MPARESAPETPRAPVLRVETVDVRPDGVEVLVRCDPERLRTSGLPGLAERAIALLPGLKGHACDNDAGARFADELRDTELAHLFEHVAVEVMAMAGTRGARGATRWDFRSDGRGVFRVTLGYDDDLVALGAVRLAATCVTWLAEGEAWGEPAPDVEMEARRLRGLRRR